MKDIRVYLTKNRKKKFEYINKKIEEKMKKGLIDNVVYICPKKYEEDAKENLSNVYIFTFEGIQKTNKHYDITSPRTFLILDGSSRYKSINSSAFKRITRVALVPDNKLMVDIVPFTAGIEYLYVPFSHLDRTILGHQHWYAFRENNQEYNKKGELVEGHDFDLLTDKIAPYCDMDYEEFLTCNPVTISNDLTEEEMEGYQEEKEKLFDKYDTISPIITRLADFANTRASRLNHLKELVDGLKGKTIIYTNIKSHNGGIKKLFKGNKNVEIKTFYDVNEDEETADNIVLAEVPIVRSYLFLDVLANIKEDCKVHFITGTTKVDKLLYKKMTSEFNSINEFTKMLAKKAKKLKLPCLKVRGS